MTQGAVIARLRMRFAEKEPKLVIGPQPPMLEHMIRQVLLPLQCPAAKVWPTSCAKTARRVVKFEVCQETLKRSPPQMPLMYATPMTPLLELP